MVAARKAVGMGESAAMDTRTAQCGCLTALCLRHFGGSLWQPASGVLLCRLFCCCRTNGGRRTAEECARRESGAYGFPFPHWRPRRDVLSKSAHTRNGGSTRQYRTFIPRRIPSQHLAHTGTRTPHQLFPHDTLAQPSPTNTAATPLSLGKHGDGQREAQLFLQSGGAG